MAKRKATSNDVARLAGVSQPTVSMILNHYENSRFSEETVRKVMDACEKLNYKTPSSRSHAPEEGASHLLVAIYPSMENLHYIRELKSIASHARSKGYTMISMTSSRDPMIEREVADMAISFKAAGVMFLYKPVNRVALNRLENQIPVVLLCDKSEMRDTSIIGLDSVKTGVIIGEHLLSLGHRRIAYVSPVLSDIYVPRQMRLAGIKKAFRDAGNFSSEIRVCTLESEGVPPDPANPSYYEAGYRLGGAVADKYPEITALVGMNDMVAVGIMDALLERKYKIPRDYSVCGCDNTILSRNRSVSLTTVELFTERRGQEAVNILIRKIEESDDAGMSSSVQVEFAPQLIARNSTGPNRRKA